MAILTLLRHGQSTYNLQNRFTGNLDVPLTKFGEEEAKLAGIKLKEYHFDLAYTSMLIRAWETLRIVLEEINQPSIPITRNAALNERVYGSLQGLNKEETALKFGTKQVEIWRRSYEVRPPDGESLEDTFHRTVPYYQSEIVPQLKSGKNVLIVAHGNSLRALKMYLENISPQEIINVNIPTCTPRVYKLAEDLQIVKVEYL